MASSTPVVRNETIINQLQKFHSKVSSPQLKALYGKFDIPRAFALIAPVRSQVVSDNDNDLAPVYLKHLEYGLRLPLHPFLRRTFDALAVSPSQMKPNSIATLVGFMVICYWLGVEPTLGLHGHLVCVKVRQHEAHYYLQRLGGHKIVANAPESNKDWKEKFIWVAGDDSILTCSSWPEIKKKALKPGLLSSTERRALEMIKVYTGSRWIKDLFNNSVLRVVGVSSTLPTVEDETRAAALTLGTEGTEEAAAAPPAPTRGGPLTRPKKRLRPDLAPEEAERA